MDELVKLVAQKANISEEKAKAAVDTMMGFIKTRLPAPLAGQVEAALSNEQMMAKAVDQAENLIEGLGGVQGLSNLLGKKK